MGTLRTAALSRGWAVWREVGHGAAAAAPGWLLRRHSRHNVLCVVDRPASILGSLLIILKYYFIDVGVSKVGKDSF